MPTKWSDAEIKDAWTQAQKLIVDKQRELPELGERQVVCLVLSTVLMDLTDGLRREEELRKDIAALTTKLSIPEGIA